MGVATGHCSPLRVEFPAAAEELPAVRHRLRDWLARILPDPDRVYDLLLAAGEACTNSVEHGHEGDRRPVCLDAALDRGLIRITVTDTGRWVGRGTAETDRGDTVSVRGRGMALMRSLVDDVRVTIREAGTTVELAAPLAA